MAMQRAIDAELIDHFGWTFEYLGTLTERQVHDYCFHLREKDTGAIVRPKDPRLLDEEEHVSLVIAISGAAGASDEATAAAVARIRAIHARRRGEDVVVPPQKLHRPSAARQRGAARRQVPEHLKNRGK